MTVLAPLLLLAGAALVVPLWLHLHRSRDPGTHAFPAIRYLVRSVEAERRSFRYRELLLLLVRCAIILLLVLAGARLVLPVGGGLHPPAQVVLVVDNGIHSGAVVGTETLLDHLVRRGEESLAALGPLDRVRIVAAGEPWRPALPLSPTEAVDALRGLESTGVLPRLAQVVERADALLEGTSEGPRRIIVLTTGVAETLLDSSPPEPPGVSVLLVNSGVDLPENRGIASVEVGDGLVPRAGEPLVISVHLAGTGVADIPVRIRIDDELAGAGRTDDTGRVRLELPPFGEGVLVGSAEIDPDALRTDDRRPFVVHLRSAPRVATPDPLHPYLEDALETLHDAGRIVRVTTGAEVVLHTAPEIPAVDPGVLRILLPPGDLSLLPAFNRSLETVGLPWRVEAGGGDARRVLAPAPGFPAGLGEVEVTDRTLLVGPPGESGVEVGTAGGDPWLVRGDSPDGSPVRLLGSPLDPAFTDLPLSAAMIPFLDRLLAPPTWGAGEVREGLGLRAGTAMELPPGAATVQRPDGQRIAVDGLRRFHDTGIPGHYEIFDSGGRGQASQAVQVPREAVGELTSTPLETMAGHWPSGVTAADDPGAHTDPFGGERRGREVATALLLGALLLLLVEGILVRTGAANRSAAVSLSSPSEPGTLGSRRS